MNDLRGRHALITGGSSGIGLAVAERLGHEGVALSLIARDTARLEGAADRLRANGIRVRTASADVSDADAVRAAIAELTTDAPVDIAVCSAGAVIPGRFLELADEDFRRMMEVDYFGVLHVLRTLAPGMVARGRGSLVAVASAAALVGVYGYSAYGPAKFAVRGLCEALRLELRPHGVHVACVYPADVDTPMLTEEKATRPAETTALNGAIPAIPPARVADAVLAAVLERRFEVYPDLRTAALARFAPLFAPVIRNSFDRAIRRVRPTEPPTP
ncbi:SDR family oxidoreductase [Nocardia puris]|uniref:3-dehydrosphinganine reductase n=1 Tax=Nocardia puris TaxID=208602 RepID=A0A366E1X3_9NOCA|nr:SDR family oxidoreductase [Nocardia puris]MBF6212809.1 SDR family oxidoreductase [Nocardia puris]MBF6367744.1 SDR family oxidoreductase [Nocardia puris]MBF6461395.1 SDR family oxidoreductase [Nocardia puris]RBO96366.1 3-dehydrosphinganine reductase [Nocardia puris]